MDTKVRAITVIERVVIISPAVVGGSPRTSVIHIDIDLPLVGAPTAIGRGVTTSIGLRAIAIHIGEM